MDLPAMARFIRRLTPGDVAAHQRKVAEADGLVFIAPIYWLGFPAILKGWFERVFTYGFAYALTPEGWQGYVKGRIPMMHQQKALVISTSLFREEGYRPLLERVMNRGHDCHQSHSHHDGEYDVRNDGEDDVPDGSERLQPARDVTEDDGGLRRSPKSITCCTGS